MNGKLQLLRLEVANDRTAFAARIDEAASVTLEPGTVDPGRLAQVAVALHHAYGALEAAMARVARVFDTEPSGANWHRSLLETMTLEVPGVRPPLVESEALDDLRELLAFRHFFRHGYQVALDPRRLMAVRAHAMRARAPVVASLMRLDAWLQTLAERT